MRMGEPLLRGIAGVVQTPFDSGGRLDEASLQRLVGSAVESGANGFLAPAVASEVGALTAAERERILEIVLAGAAGRIPVLAGASSADWMECVRHGRAAAAQGASAYLVAVPGEIYGAPERAVEWFANIAARVDLPLIVQDLEWNGGGLPVALIAEMAEKIPTLAGVKIETVPAGPKYTQVREAVGRGFFIAGGWAVPQMIEALDRGVDALMPECSMIPVYARIYRLYGSGERAAALALFRRLLPVLAYSNQELRTSIAFFKRLLVRKGIFKTGAMRGQPFMWDAHNERIAEELIDLYLDLERGAARS
ncbi:MAG: dihydrodipicolinate synthase family protein [Candidatus Solibacter usitatus]|nr:dihydrodipicolinate synthase family protein [Candidatus Solibacter usitatus]